MTQKAIGPNFANELAAAGLRDGISWDPTGNYIVDALSDADKATFAAVLAAHDPAKPDPAAAAAAMLSAGVTINSTSTPAINGTYGTSPQDEINYTGLQVAVANGVFPGWIRDKANNKHTMTGPQCTAVTTAILDFIVAVEEARDDALAGTAAWAAPPNIVTIV